MWLPRPLLRYSILTTAVLACLLTLPSCAADEFPTSVRDQTPNELVALLRRASDAEMIVASISPSTLRGRIQFNATFAKNASRDGWVFLVNVDRKRLSSANQEYKNQGYGNLVQCSASAGGKRYYTAFWTRPDAEPVQLVLPDGPIPQSGFTSSSLRPLDGFLTTFLEEHNVSGATVAVGKDGRIVYSRGFGYADVSALQQMQPDAEMRIASISKPLTGVAIMMLIQRGKLTLDTLVVPMLKKAGLPSPTGDQRWNKITVRHLLNHSGGWDRDVSQDPMFQVIEATKLLELNESARQTDIIRWKLTQSLDFDPGQRFAYSNFGYCILGRLIAIVSGQTYDDWVTENILIPRRMKHTRLGKTQLSDRGPNEVRYHMQTMTMHAPFWGGYSGVARIQFPEMVPLVEEPYGRWDLEVMDSHGGWVSTAPDLIRFVAGLDDVTGSLLDESTIGAMLAPPQLSATTDSTWYGCGWSVRTVGSNPSGLKGHNIWHNGALAGTSAVLVRRWDGFSWAVLFNTDQSSNGKRLTDLIDAKMHRTIDGISEWPQF